MTTEKSSCHLSGRLLLFAERQKKRWGRELNSPEAVICCWQTETVLDDEALSRWPGSWLSSTSAADIVHILVTYS